MGAATKALGLSVHSPWAESVHASPRAPCAEDLFPGPHPGKCCQLVTLPTPAVRGPCPHRFLMWRTALDLGGKTGC